MISKRVMIPRSVRIEKDFMNLFKHNPNSLYPTRSIKRQFKNYNESEIYHSLGMLVKCGKINVMILHNQRYYWLKRPEYY